MGALGQRFIDPIPDDRLLPVVADVTLGAPTWYAAFPGDSATWTTVLERLASWLRHLARELTENRDVYNAAKHGFAAKPSNAFIQFIDDECGEAFLRHEGPSLEALVHGPWSNGERTWRLETTWHSAEAMWAATGVGCRILDAIWGLGRARFLGGAEVNFFLPPAGPQDVHTQLGVSGMNRFSINMMSESKRPS